MFGTAAVTDSAIQCSFRHEHDSNKRIKCIPATIGWCAFFPYVHLFDFIHDNSRLYSYDETITNGANRFPCGVCVDRLNRI